VDPHEGPPGHPAWGREPGAAADRLDEADGVALNLGFLSQHFEGDAGNRDVREAEVDGRRPDEPRAFVPVADDLPVIRLDPGSEAVGLAEAILRAEALEVSLLEAVGRRLVVVRDAELERKLWHSLDRVRRNPGNCRD